MSAPTKIYLVLIAILVIVWAGVSTFVAAREPGLRFITDPEDIMRNPERFTAMLRGRVDVRDADGQSIAPPEGTLTVHVEARDAAGTLAVRRIGTVQPDGVFEVLALPYGLATVSVQLGFGETIWQREDIVVGGAGTLDPRIDPIDLGDDLFSFDIEVRGPSGSPVPGGQLAWRRIGSEDDVTFDGLAPIAPDGHARFLSTSSTIDAVCFVPGARTELFEELFLDSSLDLGIGTTVDLEVEGTLPDPERWTVHAVLDPIELRPKVDIRREGLDVSPGLIYAELDPKTGRVSIPVARGGRYQLTWRVRQNRRHSMKTERLSDVEEVVVPAEPGTYSLRRAFPIDAFLRKVSDR
ncbi:hypothetical protein Poly30_31860 [Planctomycetes bacterium Poly30]|uniref:Uncharacterized protein n=1 Tax=Saltatorellus ferox TaxID=2528018 RepID=A0A518EUD4_9BACT|nr:hypothetical protein Poly30_31860 [Planctomycetes bacterium Poly30]